jgi:F5/8 type C domain
VDVAPRVVVAPGIVKGSTLDEFTELSGWSPVTSGRAQLDISGDRGPRGRAMRLDFDFKGGGGFVVARKRFSFALPDTYAFTFDVRGAAPANKLEFKLVDPGGHNVWRYQEDAFSFSADWRSLRIRSSQIDFAWGPAGGGPVRQVGAIELAIAAPPGGKGTVWIADLGLEDHSVHSIPVVQASSAVPGHEAPCAVDRRAETSWRSEPSDEPQWFLVDFGETREYGGLIVRWDPTTTARPFDLETSDDGLAWKTVYSAGRPDAARSYVYLPQGTSRRLRFRLHRGDGDGQGIGIAEIDVRPYEFSRSLNAFFHGIAANEPRGSFPRYLCGEQTYWTPVSSAHGGAMQGLLNEDGMLEVDKGAFAIEPFLCIGEELVTWADGAPTQELEQGFLPIPSSVWRKDGIILRTTAFATGEAGKAVLYVRHRLENLETERRRLRFFAALRPFQVTPPWQAHHELGGVSRITTLESVGGVVSVNRGKVVVPLTPPSGFGAAAFGRGAVTDYLRSGDVPPEEAVSDGFGCASGALRYDLDLPPGAARDVYLAMPFGAVEAALALPSRDVDPETLLDAAVREWSAKLGARRHPPPPGRSGLHRHLQDGCGPHPDQSRRTRAPARPAPLRPIVDPGRGDHGRGPAASGLHRGGTGLRPLVRAPSSPRRHRPVLRRPSRPRLARGIRQPGRAHLRRHGALSLHRGSRLPRRDVARRHEVRRSHRSAAQPGSHRRVPDTGETGLLRAAAGVGQPRRLPGSSGPRVLG